jgi:hypothetical protein
VKQSELLKRLAVTAEVMGAEMTEEAAKFIAHKLASIPDKLIDAALNLCAEEMTGRLTLSAILDRINWGHPGVEHAWAHCLPAIDERKSIVWTEEMSEAFGAARPLLQAGDRVAARMAFKEVYIELLRTAKHERRKAIWTPSLGHNREEREAVLLEAYTAGRLCEAQYKALSVPKIGEMLDLWRPNEIKN